MHGFKHGTSIMYNAWIITIIDCDRAEPGYTVLHDPSCARKIVTLIGTVPVFLVPPPFQMIHCTRILALELEYTE